MGFTCVNCSRLTAETLNSEDLAIYRCNSCDMEYRLVTGCEDKRTGMNVSATGKEMLEANAMPIRVQIKRP